MTVSYRRFPKTCEYCGKPFLAWRSSGRYCGNLCSVRANPKPQNRVRFLVTVEMLKEAEINTPYGKSRSQYVADKLGCSDGTVRRAAFLLGYEWTFREREKVFSRTTGVERRYVREIGCVICGENRVVDAAHLIPANEGGSGMIGNIIPLCPTHHRLYDRGRLTDQENDKLVDFLYVKFPDLGKELRDEVA